MPDEEDEEAAKAAAAEEAAEADKEDARIGGMSALELLRQIGIAEKPKPKQRGGVPDLSPQEAKQADDALGGGSPRDVLVSRFSVDLTREKIESLLPGTWLNDEVI